MCTVDELDVYVDYLCAINKCYINNFMRMGENLQKQCYSTKPFHFLLQVLSTSLWGGLLLPIGDKSTNIADR